MITTNLTLCISLFLFIIGVSLTFVSIHSKKGTAKIAIIGLICSTVIALFPLYLMDPHSAPGGIIDSVFSAILGVARSMMGENSLEDTRLAFLGTSGKLSYITAIYTSFLHVIATFLLLGLLFSFFENFFPKIRYHLYRKGSLTIFSDVSERTLLLAKDMKNQEKEKKKGHSIFIFLGDSSKISMNNAHFIKELRELNAFLFNETICDIRIPILFSGRKIDFFLLGKDETNNIKEAIELTDKWSVPIKIHKKTELDIRIHILNENPEAENIIDSIECDSKLKLRLIRETRTALYHLVDTNPLFLGIRDNQLTVLIIGAGKTGMEALKTVTWCGNTLQITPRIFMVDSDKTSQQRFAQSCPELLDCSDYNIEFVTLDVTTISYTNFLKEHPEIGYIICTLKDESLNINTAMCTRGIYDEIRFLPKNKNYNKEPLINVLIAHPFLHDVMSRMQFDCKKNCNLHAFGSIEDIYTWENITGSYLDCIGIAINRFYMLEYEKSSIDELPINLRSNKIESCIHEADKHYEKREYNRCSSIALGLHCKYKMYAILVESQLNSIVSNYDWHIHPSNEMINNVSELLSRPTTSHDLVEELSKLEHRRWNAYMRTLGWRTVTVTEMNHWYNQLGTRHRNFSAKLTPCLVDWYDLPILDNEILECHPQHINDFQALDRIFVEHLPAILLEANKIYNDTFIN